MPESRSNRLRQLFDEALMLPASERITFVRRNCGPDQELFQRRYAQVAIG
jgi:hypothetical protein